jgi:hypothetical protein
MRNLRIVIILSLGVPGGTEADRDAQQARPPAIIRNRLSLTMQKRPLGLRQPPQVNMQKVTLSRAEKNCAQHFA